MNRARWKELDAKQLSRGHGMNLLSSLIPEEVFHGLGNGDFFITHLLSLQALAANAIFKSQFLTDIIEKTHHRERTNFMLKQFSTTTGSTSSLSPSENTSGREKTGVCYDAKQHY